MRRALFIPIVASFAFAVSACELYLGGHITNQQDIQSPDAGYGPCDHDGGNCYTQDAADYHWDGGSPWWPDAQLAPDGGCIHPSDAGSYYPDAALYPDGGWIHPVDAH
jgi:hypothetical protein